jgi:hypothetical protein
MRSNNTEGVLSEPVQMIPQYTTLFTEVDDYVRRSHQCFVAECFLIRENTMWAICVRPTNENPRILDRYACKYIQVTLKEAEEISTSKTLGPDLRQKIDSDLDAIISGRS